MEDNTGSSAVELDQGVFWVGTLKEQRGLDCNPYLIIEQEEGVLIDPGSVIDFETVKKNVEAIIPLEKIRYIILHHQDPDLCSSTPLFEEAGFTGKIVTHWRTSFFIQYYGIRSPLHILNENGFLLKLSEKRTLHFIPAPYMHFPGAVMTLDPVTKILFSGDVFGAFSYKRRLWAEDDYAEAMKVFHENYIPSNDIIRPVMEKLLTLPLEIIAPQHGSIIKGRNKIIESIHILKELECGGYLTAIRKELAEAGNYTGLCNKVLKRYYALFPREEIIRIFDNTEIILDKNSGMIQDYKSTGNELWNNLFQIIYMNKDIKWLTAIESLVEKLAAEYDIELPDVFHSALISNQKQLQQLDETNRELRLEAEKMKSQLSEISNQLMRCPLTGLYNEKFFIEFLQSRQKEKDIEYSILFIEIDNIISINNEYDKNVGDELISGVAYLIMNYIKEDASRINNLLIKLNAPGFALYIPVTDKQAVRQIAERIRNDIRNAEIFIQPVTVSIGIVFSTEFIETKNEREVTALALLQQGQARALQARKSGGNSICDYIPDQSRKKSRGKIVIAEPDELIREVFGDAFEERNIQVFSSKDGRSALKQIETEIPDVIICELNIPQLDGLTLKQRLNSSSRFSSVPFIMLSGHKTDKVIKQAIELNIRHFFSKPLSVMEITGLVENILKFDY